MMANMGRCGTHGCAFSVRLVNGVREEYCPECALATAQAERDAALQRAEDNWRAAIHARATAEQAEAAIAQAQAALVPFARLCHADGIELPDLSCDPHEWREAIAHAEAAQQKLKEESAACRHNYVVLCETGQWNDAQPPALPPLPIGWVREGVRDIILYRTHDRYAGVDGHVPPGGQVSVHEEGLRVSTTHVPVEELLTVIRHAEAAHQCLQQAGE